MNCNSLASVKGKDYIGVGVGAIVVNDKNEVLLLLRKRDPEANSWSIPGGSVEFGESLEHAILRELEEEVGVEAKIIRQIKATDLILNNQSVHWVVSIFLVKITNGVPINREPDTHSAIGWFLIQDLPKNIAVNASNAIRAYIDSVYRCDGKE